MNLSPGRLTDNADLGGPDYRLNIRKALARSFFFNAAWFDPKKANDVYTTMHTGSQAGLDPDSGLIGLDAEWVVYETYSQAGKQYIGTVTAVGAEWLVVSASFESNMATNFDNKQDLPHFADHKWMLTRHPDPMDRVRRQRGAWESLQAARGRKDTQKRTARGSLVQTTLGRHGSMAFPRLALSLHVFRFRSSQIVKKLDVLSKQRVACVSSLKITHVILSICPNRDIIHFKVRILGEPWAYADLLHSTDSDMDSFVVRILADYSASQTLFNTYLCISYSFYFIQCKEGLFIKQPFLQ